MKCTNKRLLKKIIVLIASILLIFACTGCSITDNNISNKYDIFTSACDYNLTASLTSTDFFSSDLCVADNSDTGTDRINSSLGESAVMFSLSDNEVCYAQDIYSKRYPASTTKILTAYIAIKYGNLTDKITVSSSALSSITSDSSVCGLRVGDTLTLTDLLYGLMMASGNDAASVIAEYISGSIDEFANLMNKEARLIGATHSHFVNPHGLHDDNHYTTVYDMYLIFNKALQNEEFYKIISSSSYNASYKNSSNQTVNVIWNSTNWYLNGTVSQPEGITVIGGKTGTTSAAGACLVLLSKDDNNNKYISIVYKASSHYTLYSYMTEILTGFSK